MVQNGRVCPDHACVHKFLDFYNPYGVICTFYRVEHGTEYDSKNEAGPRIGELKRELGGSKTG